MFHCLPGELHSGSRREHKAVTQILGTRQALPRFLRRIFRGDGLFGTEGNDTDVPLALFLGDEPREGSDRVFADDVGRSAVILGSAAAPEVDNVSGAARFHKRDDILRAQESSAEIGLNDVVPKILAHEADARPTRDAPVKVGNDTSVVDQHVDLTVAIDDLVNHPAHLVLVAHVRRPEPTPRI